MSQTEGPLPWVRDGEGIRLAVRVTPRAARDEVVGVVREADGRSALAVRLAAPPVGGAANTALRRLLAKCLGTRRSAIALRSGEHARLKILHVRGDPDDLLSRLRSISGQ